MANLVTVPMTLALKLTLWIDQLSIFLIKRSVAYVCLYMPPLTSPDPTVHVRMSAKST
jgi:hypothetical protein